jgi:hypothetical protein
MKKVRAALIAVGVISIAMAVAGLWYNLTTVFTDFGDLTQVVPV